MERTRLNMRVRCSGSTPSEESALDVERNCSHPNLPSLSPPTLQPFASAGQHCESNAAYFSWPTSSRLNDAAEERANYFANLQKGVLPETLGRLPKGQQATTLLELMTIRAFHSKILRCYSLGTAVGFRIKRGMLTDIPAILVFVSRKVHKQWLSPIQCLPSALEVREKPYLLSFFFFFFTFSFGGRRKGLACCRAFFDILSLDFLVVVKIIFKLPSFVRDLEGYGAMWMWWSSHTLVHLSQLPKNSYTQKL